MNDLIVIMNNSVSSVSGQNRNNFKFFSGGPEEKEIRVRRAGQLAAAGAAANCDASIGCSIPRRSAKPGAGRALTASAKEVRFPSVLRQALRGRDSASAGGYRAVGASLPSACQPRQRRAKCEAASIRCSIPRCTRSVSGAGGGRPADAAKEVILPLGQVCGKSAGSKFYGFGCEALENERLMTIEEKSEGIRNKIHRTVHGVERGAARADKVEVLVVFVQSGGRKSFCPNRDFGLPVREVFRDVDHAGPSVVRKIAGAPSARDIYRCAVGAEQIYIKI